MKVIVAFDSVHGNTQKVAEAIAEEVRGTGHQAELVSLRDEGDQRPDGDLLFIGSPTRGGKMTKNAKAFLEALDVDRWRDKRIAAFDTLGPLSKNADRRGQQLETIRGSQKTAAARMQEVCTSRGLACSDILHVPVVGMFGPLASESLDMARGFVRGVVAGEK